MQDAYAIESLTRAKRAIREGKFKDEIAPVVVKTRKGEFTVDTDEQPGKANLQKIPTLKPAFAKERHRDTGQFQFHLRRRSGSWYYSGRMTPAPAV